jgi:EryCIII-like glycosyltransferase
MRILWTSTPMEGVFLPFVPVARVLQDRGHELLVAAGPDVAARVAEAGFEQRVIGPAAMEAAMRAFADPAVAAADGAGTVFGAVMFGSVFAPALLPEIRRIAEQFHPAVIVHPAVETSGAIVAAQRGVPSVTYGFAQPIEPAMVRALAERVATLWTSAGLSADKPAGIYRDLYLDPCPPTLRLGDRAAPCPVQLVRPETAGRLGGVLPERVARLGARPVVYVSLGTVPLFSQMQTFSVLLGRTRSMRRAFDTLSRRSSRPTARNVQLPCASRTRSPQCRTPKRQPRRSSSSFTTAANSARSGATTAHPARSAARRPVRRRAVDPRAVRAPSSRYGASVPPQAVTRHRRGANPAPAKAQRRCSSRGSP